MRSKIPGYQEHKPTQDSQVGKAPPSNFENSMTKARVKEAKEAARKDEAEAAQAWEAEFA